MTIREARIALSTEWNTRARVWIRRMMVLLLLITVLPFGSVPAQDKIPDDLYETSGEEVDHLIAEDADPTLPPAHLFSTSRIKKPADKDAPSLPDVDVGHKKVDPSTYGQDVFKEGAEIGITEDLLNDGPKIREIARPDPVQQQSLPEITEPVVTEQKRGVVPDASRLPKELVDEKTYKEDISPRAPSEEADVGDLRQNPLQVVSPDDVADSPSVMGNEDLRPIPFDPVQDKISVGMTIQEAEDLLREKTAQPQKALPEEEGTLIPNAIHPSPRPQREQKLAQPAGVKPQNPDPFSEAVDLFGGNQNLALPERGVIKKSSGTWTKLSETQTSQGTKSQITQRPVSQSPVPVSAATQSPPPKQTYVMEDLPDSVDLEDNLMREAPMDRLRAPLQQALIEAERRERAQEDKQREIESLREKIRDLERNMARKEAGYVDHESDRFVESQTRQTENRLAPQGVEAQNMLEIDLPDRALSTVSDEDPNRVNLPTLRRHLMATGTPDTQVIDYRSDFLTARRGLSATAVDGRLFGEVQTKGPSGDVVLPGERRRDSVKRIGEILNQQNPSGLKDPFQGESSSDQTHNIENRLPTERPGGVRRLARDVIMSDPFTGEVIYGRNDYADSPEDVLALRQSASVAKPHSHENRGASELGSQQGSSMNVAPHMKELISRLAQEIAQAQGKNKADVEMELAEILAEEGALSDAFKPQPFEGFPAADQRGFTNENQQAMWDERGAVSQDFIRETTSSVRYFPTGPFLTGTPSYQQGPMQQQAPSAFDLARSQATAPWNRGRVQLYYPELRSRSQFVPYDRINSSTGFRGFNPAVNPAIQYPGTQPWSAPVPPTPMMQQSQNSLPVLGRPDNPRVRTVFDAPPVQGSTFSQTQPPEPAYYSRPTAIDPSGTLRGQKTVTSPRYEMMHLRNPQFEIMPDFSGHGIQTLNPARSTVRQEVPRQIQELWNKPVAVIFYANGSSQLDWNEEMMLKKLARIAKDHPRGLLVVGHASARTKNKSLPDQDRVNLELSLKRAQRVKDVLVKHGVRPAQITIEAQGSGVQITEESMPRGEAWNRRVEVYLR